MYSPTASKLIPPCDVLAPVALELDVDVVGADEGLPCWPGLIFTGVSLVSFVVVACSSCACSVSASC